MDEILFGALCITVTSAIFCSRCIQLVFISCKTHLREVKCAIHTAASLRHIHIESKLLVQQPEVTVAAVVFIKKINPWRR